SAKVVADFWYEDYELNGMEASLHLPRDRQYKGKKFEVKARLFDSNNLEVPGASVTLELLSDYVNQLYTPSIFIPNKLWEHKQILDPLGPTRIVIPDSIFPLVDLGYRIQATFETVDGKSSTQKASAFYYHDPCQIIFQEKRDQITVEVADLDACPLKDSLAQVLMQNNQQILFDQSLSLPTALPLNPMATKYEIRWGEYTETYEPQADLLEVGGERTKDSLFIQISNPQGLSVWYELWEGKKKAILRGSERTLFLRIKARKEKPYFLTVSHMWRGKLTTQNYLFHLTPHKLQVELDAPEKVYPGQNIPLTISVKDYQGVPVQGADVLAYALTSKFYRYPSLEIPHAADPIPTQSTYNSFKKTQLRKTQTYALDFPFWQQAFTLDKDTAYQLLYPGKEPYHVYFPSIHEKTQFTPVVVEQGKPVPIMVAYLDRTPTHVAGVMEPYPYTIFADSGWHDLMIKTYDRILQIDSVYFVPGKQTVISIDQAQCDCSQNVEEDVLGDQELRRLSQSLIKIAHGYPQTSPAYIQQGDRVHLLGYLARRDYSSYKPNMYIGPLTSDSVHFEALGKFKLSFSYQYGYTHTFFTQMLMVKADPWDLDELRMQILQTRFTSPELATLVQPAISPYDLKKIYAEAIKASVDRTTKYKHPQATSSGNGTMLISPLYPKPDILLLFRHKDTSFLRVYPGRAQVFHQLPPDNYYLQAWYSDSQYVLIDSLDIPPNGRTYFQWDSLPIQQADSLMKQLYQLATAKWEDELAADSQKRKIKQIEQVKRPVLDGPLIQITGQVVDLETGEPIEGVAVVIKGSNVGMYTDAEGYFNLEAPHNALLHFGFLGKTADEQPAYKFSVFNAQPQVVAMETDTMLLSEVVVGGENLIPQIYSEIDVIHVPNPLFKPDIITVDAWARQLTSSLDTSGARESAVKYYIDGIKVSGSQALPVQSIVNSQLISDETNPKLTVWITTDGSVELPDGPRFKAKGDQEIPLQDLLDEPAALRTNFDDVAYWRPRLITDPNGEATFFATLPDDITQWRHRALVYDFAGKSGGQATAFSRSYKSLMAQLSLPRFLVEGDQTTAFGRAENLLGDSLNVRLSFASKYQNYGNKNILLNRYQIDTLQFQAPAAQDSLALTFRLDMAENEYYDGETRRIPLFKKGDKQIEGQYKILNRGESMELHASDNYPVQVVAHANKLEICLKEIARVQAYRYDCNEQLASKLKTLLMAQRIHQQLQRPFRKEKRVRELIKKLEKSHNESLLWGWWAGNTTTPWINQHVIEALLQAEEMGYSILLSKNLIQREIIFQLSHRTLPAHVQVPFLETLENMGADFPFEDFIPKVEADTLLNPVDKLRLIRLRQKLDMDLPLDTLWKYQEETSLDEIYWKGRGWGLRYQTIPATLTAYQILADMKGQEAKLDKMEAWLLKQRKPTGWNNTYYTSQILETILARLLDGGSELEAPQLLAYTSTGVDTIRVFPYKRAFLPGQLQQLVHRGQT
ncbi:MAG: carboxypeptidase-like regulatory domain-containing protein, partial [Bacteroidota bacterium]